ncbi:MAG: sugar phosphate isomerase/epimerase family protein [Novosphingobium meiothermophilum]|uniref:sugar phosphate isomerase/epimerase family protein n=1 Tax=Novosphingobium TaxID=165696 RepID=UPI000D6E45C5|nr:MULTISPECIES: sugar phosphate isomerase/epimerase family protein [Novosphingobium]
MESLVFCSAPFAHVPLLDRLAPVADAGFSALSLMPADVWTLEEQGMPASEIRARIIDAGLAVAEMDCTACWTQRQRTTSGNDDLSRLLRTLTAERVVATAARMEARSVAAIDLSSSPPALDEAAQGFAALCDMAAEHGLRAHIEFLPSSAIRSLTEAWAIVDAAGRPNGGVTIDALHFFRSGSTLDQLAAVPAERIHTVQLSDAPRELSDDLWTELMTKRLLPGEGALDIGGLIRTLDSIGSTAPMGIEVFNTRYADRPLGEVARDFASTGRAVIAQARGQA